MLTAYLDAAMRHAHYELLDDQPDTPYYGSIADLQGLLAVGATLEECRDELRAALEVWVLTGVHHGDPLPVIDQIDLNALLNPSEEAP
jgi:predicted RNase H-like HicB family nuclease